MEEWDFVDEHELQGWKGAYICMTCQHFAYGVDRHCHTLVGCNLRQRQLQQGEHITRGANSGHQRGKRSWAGLLRRVGSSAPKRRVSQRWCLRVWPNQASIGRTCFFVLDPYR